ncbi:hypothetical protein [Sphingomonas sp. CFBP 13720]|uniref:hypothetical protein n=1 Tax=Sphingomonas sp. CFBP 13720 TaxID=2775302 RepID=UPI0017836D18|nr:hypothetical protein [Sphingomonas sp. CFBP 13720]MBD8678586.1 hypothetical protein [Sphingomonas sp. CFBP 13720]
MPPVFASTAALLQIGATVAAFASFALWPPAHGKLLLVPIDGSDRNAVSRLALDSGASLSESGPLPGSMIVLGDRHAIGLRGARLLVLAAPAFSCGSATDRGTAS